MNIKTFIVLIEIDIECSDLLDVIGLTYEISENDNTQNIIEFLFTEDELEDIFKSIAFINLNKKIISSRILNPDLSEYTSKVIIEKPDGNNISFY